MMIPSGKPSEFCELEAMAQKSPDRGWSLWSPKNFTRIVILLSVIQNKLFSWFIHRFLGIKCKGQINWLETYCY